MLTKFYPGAHSHNLHFERGKDLFRTFSGAAERFKELAQKNPVYSKYGTPIIKSLSTWTNFFTKKKIQ